MSTPMRRVNEVLSSKMGDYLTNFKTWGGVMYNVLENGLFGDGGTDDTAALQTLINTAIASGRKAIFFPHTETGGEYYVTSLSNADQVVFFGDNASFVGGYTGEIGQIGGVPDMSQFVPKDDLPYNVRDYGIVGDGTTNDTLALQTLINTAIAAGRKAIYFPHGTYFVTSLSSANQVLFYGDAATFTGGYTGTILQMGDWATNEQLADFVSVKNLGAKGDGSDEGALIKSIVDANKGRRIYFSKGTYNVASMTPVDGLVTIYGEGVIVGFKYSELNPPQYGYRDPTSANDAFFTAEGLTFEGTGDTPGLTIYNAPATVNRSFKLINCVFRGKFGLLTQNCAHSEMTLCEFVQNQYGWESQSCSNLTVSDCNFFAQYGAGLKISTSDDAIFGHGGENIKMANCLFFDSVMGIYCENHNYLWLDNILMDYVNLGLYLHGSRMCFISDSYIGFGQGDRSDMPLYVAPPGFGCVYGVPDIPTTRTTGIEAINTEFRGYADALTDTVVLDAQAAALGIEQSEFTNCSFHADPASNFDYLLRISGNVLNIKHTYNIYVAPNNSNLVAPYLIPNIPTLFNERNNIAECYRPGGAKITVSFGYVGNEKFESASVICITNGTPVSEANNYVFKNSYSTFPRVLANVKIGPASYPAYKLNVGVSGADTVQAFFQASHIDGTNMTAGQQITVDVLIIGQ